MAAARSIGQVLLTLGAVVALGACVDLKGLGGAAGGEADASPPLSEGGLCNGDLTRDPRNCGLCGHDCLGGDCVASACMPVILASGQATPEAIAVDPTTSTVYWTNLGDGTVIALRAGGGPRAVATGQPGPRGIAVHAGSVYFTNLNGGTVMVIESSGPRELAKTDAEPYDLAVTDANVYWVARGGSTVARAATTGGASTTIASAQPSPLAITADARGATWVVEGTAANGYSDGAVWQATGTSPARALATVQRPRGIAAVDSTIYVTSYAADGAVFAYDEATSKLTKVASAQQQPLGIAADQQNIYWLDEHPGGTVMALSRTDSSAAPRVLASNQSSPHAIAVDATSLYWTNAGDGTVMRLAKP
jgi:sugar lactone lactonase YvrE